MGGILLVVVRFDLCYFGLQMGGSFDQLLLLKAEIGVGLTPISAIAVFERL